MLFKINHLTEYHYSESVKFCTHRLLLRPRENHELSVKEEVLEIFPNHRLRWIEDTFGNSLALVDFSENSSILSIRSRLSVEQRRSNPFDFLIEGSANRMPFNYGHQERLDLDPFLLIEHPNDAGALKEWIGSILSQADRSETIDQLLSLNQAIKKTFDYQQREEMGVQSPGETLVRRGGTCRDFTLFLMEVGRILGVAARFVSGYLAEEEESSSPATPLSSTHAWCEFYLPGAGWKGFDPTSGLLAAETHLPVAVSRSATQIPPVAGSFIGPQAQLLAMRVEVSVQKVFST